MAPGGPGNKRKRGGGYDDGPRPSPYRPNSSGMAQHGYGGPPHGGYHEDRGGRGGRRGGRGGRGRGHPRAPENPNGTAFNQRRESQSNQQQTSRPQSQQSQTHPEPVAAPEKPATPQTPAEPPQPAAPVDPYAVAAAMKFPPLDRPPQPYTYEYITDEIAQSWKESGRASLLDKAAALKKENNDAELSIVYGELLRAGLDGKVPPADVGSFVKDVLAVESGSEEMDQGGYMPDAVSDFLDLVSVLHEKDCDNPRLTAILFASEISHDKMREELDSEMLVQLNLVRNTFKKSFIRHQTNVLYRQSNYNLLREETEGYSKLMTELFTTSANETPSADVVKATFERVRSMIGTFDLDVGRVLDVSLDVFAAVLVREYRFFVKFLRCSSWWPSEAKNSVRAPGLPHWASPDANGFEPLSEERKASLADERQSRDTRFWEYARQLAVRGKGLEAFFRLRNMGTVFSNDESTNNAEEDPTSWKAVTGTEAPVGNKIAAQILGFKLRFYSSQARDTTDELPNNLIHLAALLIKIGFISLQDLYPHLWPHDDEMDKVRKQKEQEAEERKKAARPGGGENALTRAGALSDDAPPPTLRSREAETKAAAKAEIAPEPEKKPEDELSEPKDTKIALLKALLAIGAIPEALFMLGRFPWLLKLVHDLPEYVHRLLNYSISKLYEPLKPLQGILELQEAALVADADQSGVSRGELRRIKQPTLKVLRWANLDREMTDEGVHYRFYWEDWNDNMPICQSVDDLFSLCDSFMCLSGVRIGQDPSLLTKIYRIGINSLETDKSGSNKQRWIELCKKLLVPALSLTGHNSPVVNECWEMLKRFSQKTRYSIYAEWNLGPTSRLDDVANAFTVTRAKTLDVLKKISKTNTKPMARALAKVATNSPGVVFDNAIRSMENYSNLVEVVVECARYFTALGYDVLTWSTLQSLGRARVRHSEDGMFASKWLSALSSFFGKVYWRFSMMNLSPTLQYLAHQLYRGNAADLKVFEELLLNMGGIRSDVTLNDAQIVAMAGGPLLQKEVLLSLQDNRFSSRPTARRLMRALIDTNLVGAFVVSIGQERQTQLYKLGKDGAPLKLLGNAFDDMHQTLTQYLAFLREFLPSEDFDRFVPALGQLIGEFGLEPRIAFWICRTSIANKMEDFDKAEVDSKKILQQQPSEAVDVEMTDETSGNADTEMTDVAPDAEPAPSAPTTEVGLPGWHPVLRELMDQTRDALNTDDLSLVGELFYMTFWQLSQVDLYVPQDSYDAEYNRIAQKQRAVTADRTDNTISGTRKRDAARAQLASVRDQLQAEHKEQVKTHRGFTQNRIAKEKEHWFAHTSGQYDALNTALLEQCFIPRMLLSQVDAYYCFRMLKMLHSEGAKNFRTMGFLDQFFNQKRLAMLFFMCTLKEAENLAVFINEVLKHLGRWHARKETYESEALGSRRDLPGFCKKIGDDKASFVFLNYEDEFKRLLFKWHGQLANAIRQCLEGGEYMHIRNAITVLRGVVAGFPVVDTQGKKLLEVVTNVGKTESRGDLKLAAQSLLGALTRRERNREWVSLAAFYPAKNAGGATPGAGNSSSPADAKGLNAEAAEFKPSRLNGTKAIAEHEDGEINSPTVAEAPKDRKAGQPASAAAHTTPSAVTATGKAAVSDETRPESNSRSGPLRSDGRGDGRPSPAPGSRAESSGRLTNGATRPSHNLPARPEGAPPHGRRGERGYPRDYNRDGRLSREERDPGYPDPARGARSMERRVPDRSHERGPERPPVSERDRPDLMRRGEGQPSRHQPTNEREVRQPSRSERPERLDRLERSTREGRDHGRELQSRDDPSRGNPGGEMNMPPPAPAVNPDRARLIEEDQASANRDRQARDASRSGSQRNSRVNSPTRRDDRSHRGSHREEHRSVPHESRSERPHLEERRAAGPRGDDFDGHDDRGRPSRSGHPPVELHAPRHSRDHGAPPGESHYGRLNGPEAPTGPRGSISGAPGRPSRVPAGPAAAPLSSNTERLGERPTPSGPASSRAPPRINPAAQGRPGSDSAPSTPIGETAASGVHPERARQIQANGPAAPGSASSSAAPRGPAGAPPTGPTRSTPSGPQSGPPTPTFDRPRGDKRFANVNTTLQQNSGPPARSEQGATIRGRGGRSMPQSPLGPGPTPLGAPSGPGRHDAGPRGDVMGPPRSDLFANQESSGRRGGPEPADRRPRGSGRSPSPTRRGPPPQMPVSTPENVRPPRRMDSRDNMRSSRDAPPPSGPPGPVPDRDRRGPPRDQYGSAHGSGRHGGGERRDVRDVSWGGERPADRRTDAPIPPEGPGSGRKRRNEHDDYTSGDPKRHRRGHR